MAGKKSQEDYLRDMALAAKEKGMTYGQYQAYLLTHSGGFMTKHGNATKPKAAQ